MPSSSPSESVVGPSPTSAATPTVADPEAQGAWRNALAAWLLAHRVYPEAARRDGAEGRVVVRFTLGRDGAVHDVALVRSSGSAVLDDAAVAMLRGARLPPPPPPAPDTVTLTLPIRYSLAP